MIQALHRLLSPDRPICVALSGGVDSMVLADLAAQWAQESGQPVYAVHVNHGLSANAEAWTAFVEAFCKTRSIELKTTRVTLERKPRESLEDLARKRRYQALINLSPARSQILLAHHLDDQLETILLALKRGAGSLRLGGIRPIVEAPEDKLYLRPLLDFPKQEILAWANERGLDWVEDESNADSGYDRNFLRNEIIPLLKSRWRGILTATRRTSKILQAESRLVMRYADEVLDKICDAEGQILVAKISALSADERSIAIRAWVKRQGHNPPREDKVEKVHQEVAMARPDRKPVMHFEGYSITRIKGTLVLLS